MSIYDRLMIVVYIAKYTCMNICTLMTLYGSQVLEFRKLRFDFLTANYRYTVITGVRYTLFETAWVQCVYQ